MLSRDEKLLSTFQKIKELNMNKMVENPEFVFPTSVSFAQLSNLLAGNISIVHGVVGSSRTFMGEEGSGVQAVQTAHARIRAGQSEIALVGGAYNAVVLTFRFAAADCVVADLRPRALSAVMAGGVFAGILGPQLVTSTMNLWLPYLFAATFLAQAALAAVSAFVLAGTMKRVRRSRRSTR